MNQLELYLDDPGVDILNVTAALIQMHDMQAEVHTGPDERLTGECKQVSLVDQSHTNLVHEDFQKGGKGNLKGVVNMHAIVQVDEHESEGMYSHG